MSNQDALHEGRHCSIARVLGIPIVYAVASGGNPHVRTRLQWRASDPEENARWLARDAVVALSGMIDEPDTNRAASDRDHAWRRCREIIALEDGQSIKRLERLDEHQLQDAAALLAHLTLEAARLVQEHYALIAQVAHRLEDAGAAGLSGAAIDAILLDLKT
jgi:hypothetical protein